MAGSLWDFAPRLRRRCLDELQELADHGLRKRSKILEVWAAKVEGNLNEQAEGNAGIRVSCRAS